MSWFFHFFWGMGVAYLCLSALARRLERRTSYLIFMTLGAALLMVAVPIRWTGEWMILLWLFESQILLVAGFLLREPYFRGLSWAGFVVLISKLLILDTGMTSALDAGSVAGPNSLIFALVALCFYANRYCVYRRFAPSNWESPGSRIFSYVASILVAVLIWYEMPTLGVALGWGLAAVLLVELGRKWPDYDLRLQGYAAGVLCFIRLFMANLISGQVLAEVVSFRLLSVVVIAAYFYYLFWLLRRERSTGRLQSREHGVPELFSTLAVVSLAALFRFEFPTPWVAAAWSSMAFLYLFIGTRQDDRHFRLQGYGLVAVALFRTLTTNLMLPATGADPAPRVLNTLAVIALLYCCYALLLTAQRHAWYRRETGRGVWGWFEEKGLDLCFCSASTLMVILTYQESPAHLLTILWGVEGLVLFLVGLIIARQDFRLFGVGLLLICTLKIFFYDLEGLDTVPRIFSFIVLGVILLVVSFLYTRFGAVIKRYL